MIYAFYGRLSVASTDVEKFKASKIPPTFLLMGHATRSIANSKHVPTPCVKRVSK